jgi:hypothetical protein
MFAEVLDSLVPNANADVSQTITYDHCITPNASRTRAEVVIVVSWVESSGCEMNAKFRAKVPVDENFHVMTAYWNACRLGELNPRVKLTSLEGNAVGRFECGCGLASDFDLGIADCNLTSTPVCSEQCIPAASDIRLKTNIEALSISREGYNLYKFQYIGEDNKNTYVGVMAQDIISSRPDAVVQNESGFYMVRYDRLGLKMVTLDQWMNEGPACVELIH